MDVRGKVQLDSGRTVVVNYHVLCILVSEPEAFCVVGEFHDLGLKASLLHYGVVDICRRRSQIPGRGTAVSASLIHSALDPLSLV